MAKLNLAGWWILCTYVIYITSFMVVAESSNGEDFIDPLDMLNFDGVNMRMKDQAGSQQSSHDKKTDGESSCEKYPPFGEATEDVCSKHKELYETGILLLRQYCMSLVQLMESTIGSTSHPTLLDLRVSATYHGLTKLRKFGEGINSDFHAVYETLTTSMQYAKPVTQKSGFSRFYWLEDKLGLSFSMMAHITVLIISCLLLVVAISHLRYSKELIWRLLIVIFLISVVMTMVEMYQGKVAEQEKLLRNSVRKHCLEAEKMSVWERIFTYVTSHFTFEDDECKEFMEAMLVNPLVTVNPLQALAVAVVKTVVTPMELIGQGIRNFLVGLLKGLPLQIQTFVLICLFCLVILWPLLLMGYNFNFFYLINIGPQRVVKEIQYVSVPSGSNCEQLPSSVRNQVRLSHPNEYPHCSSPTTLQAEAIGSGDANFLAVQPSAGIKQIELKSTGSQSCEAAPKVPSSEEIKETKASKLHTTLGQCDGGDVQIDQNTVSDIQTCGDMKGREPSSGDLCHKMAQVTISRCIPLEKSQNDDPNMVSLKDKSDPKRSVDNEPNGQHRLDSASADLSTDLQNLKLQETKDSVDKKISDLL